MTDVERRYETLTAAEKKLYVAALSTSTDERHDVDLLTLDHHPVDTVEPLALSGQVDYHADSDVDRTLTLSLLDVNHELGIDSPSLQDGSMGADRLIRVKHKLFVPTLDDPCYVVRPIFTGVPVNPERYGDSLSITASDVAVRYMAPREIPHYTIHKGQLLVPAIKDCLQRCGQTKFAFPADKKTRVAHETPISGPDPERAPWPVLRRMAKAAGYQLFNDANAYSVMRRPSTTPVVRWETDLNSSTLTDFVRSSTDFSTIRNRVVVQGKKGVKVVVDLPASHPFSAHSLASGGEPCYLVMRYEDKNIGSKAEAHRVGKRELGKTELEAVAVSFPCVPVYHLEPQDAFTFTTRFGSRLARLREASVPIGDGDMTVGYQVRVHKPVAKKIRPAA